MFSMNTQFCQLWNTKYKGMLQEKKQSIWLQQKHIFVEDSNERPNLGTRPKKKKGENRKVVTPALHLTINFMRMM